MESKYLTPEKNLILRIIEQWGNAATMGEMEQWLKNYANSTKGQLVNALRQIEQMSDPGDYYKAICDMKSIATNALTGDESAAGREEDAVEFAEWIREVNYKPYAGSWYLNGNNYAHQPYSTRNLYELFKQRKEKK